MAQTSLKPDMDQRKPFGARDSYNPQWRSRAMDAFYPCPGTITARTHGCSCPHAMIGQGTHENPYQLNVYCPLHGVNAVAEYRKGPRH
jgi:hypothetical protein